MIVKGDKYEVKETWTNIAYALLGIVAVSIHNDILMGLAASTLAVGSYYFHRTKSHKFFDWYGIVLILLVASGQLIESHSYWIVIIAYLCIYGFFLMGRLGVNIEVGISSLFALIASYIHRGLMATLLIAAFFGLCLFIRTKDCGVRQDVFHDSWGHSAWHILTAIGIYLLRYG